MCSFADPAFAFEAKDFDKLEVLARKQLDKYFAGRKTTAMLRSTLAQMWHQDPHRTLEMLRKIVVNQEWPPQEPQEAQERRRTQNAPSPI